MNIKEVILSIFFGFLASSGVNAQLPSGSFRYEVFGDTMELYVHSSVAIPFEGPLTGANLKAFHAEIKGSYYQPVVDALLHFKQEHKLNDWLYYQLVRKTAQQLAPKTDNYYRYTLYKWFLLARSGYDVTLNILNDQLLFYVFSEDDVFNLPLYEKDGRQYVCLNIHDYARGTRQLYDTIHYVDLMEPGATYPFSYKVTRLPEFNASAYLDKEVRFPYGDREFNFLLKVNPQVENIFANYPTVPYEDYFNIPMSRTTYQSLVPLLKNNLKGLKVKKGIDYLLNFTRYAFLYEDDQDHFGREKRMGPEQTLLSSASDCDDRAALFFYLVKEIYNLPMIALVYPSHITIAVQFEKPVGKTIEYKGNKYSICEPTPQQRNFSIGYLAPKLRHEPYEVVYAYSPKK